MKHHLIVLLLLFTLISSCRITKEKSNTTPEEIVTTGPIEINQSIRTNNGSEDATIRGKVTDENNEPAIYVTIRFDGISLGALTDEDGMFELTTIPPGKYTLQFTYVGSEMSTLELELIAGDVLEIDASIALKGSVELLKPIIYIYPTDTTDVHVQLDYAGAVTTTYPSYPINGWKVTANPDGTLRDAHNKEYYALYWEGIPREPLSIQNGFVVPRAQTVSFLEEKLAELGLNSRESNEFIIFWLPILEKNAFNVIHFAGDDYVEQAKLTINPAPETVIRIAMVFQGCDEEIAFPLQDLHSLKKKRKGFTVVEWGGQELPKSFKIGV